MGHGLKIAVVMYIVVAEWIACRSFETVDHYYIHGCNVGNVVRYTADQTAILVLYSEDISVYRL